MCVLHSLSQCLKKEWPAKGTVACPLPLEWWAERQSGGGEFRASGKQSGHNWNLTVLTCLHLQEEPENLVAWPLRAAAGPVLSSEILTGFTGRSSGELGQFTFVHPPGYSLFCGFYFGTAQAHSCYCSFHSFGASLSFCHVPVHTKTLTTKGR